MSFPFPNFQWEVVPITAGMTHLSLQDILVPLRASKSGVAYNPGADVVQFAFMPQPTQVPITSDWQTGSWQTVATDVLYPYRAVCLVGPSGTIALGIGNYVIYVKVTDSPEVPVLYSGTLQIS